MCLSFELLRHAIERLHQPAQLIAGRRLHAVIQVATGKLSRGLLEVAVENSAVLQELAFSKQQIIAELNGLLDGQRIRDIRFRVSPLDR